MAYSNLKRLFDIAVAGSMVLIISPLMIVLVLILTLHFRGNPFFVQRRPGKAGVSFTMLKLRTLTSTANSEGVLLPDIERVTRLGWLLRVLSLDELPQLINVLKGDMSLVGPRPLLEEYLPLYSEEQAIRHTVKPGITGWAQVSGGNTITWEERLACDVLYVRNMTFAFDLKILFYTLTGFLKAGQTWAAAPHFSAPFKGSEQVADIETQC